LKSGIVAISFISPVGGAKLAKAAGSIAHTGYWQKRPVVSQFN
jgi:hypothetical protein